MRIEPINGTLHQWDTGRQVQVTLDEGTTLREVRFSHHRSPSPVRVAPEAGNVADIPDELLRHSGMLWVTAIVVDAYGKPQTHSRCVCTECAVRPDDYSAGGGSGGGSAGGGSDKVYILRFENYNLPSQNNYDESKSINFEFSELFNAIRESDVKGVPDVRILTIYHTEGEVDGVQRESSDYSVSTPLFMQATSIIPHPDTGEWIAAPNIIIVNYDNSYRVWEDGTITNG